MSSRDHEDHQNRSSCLHHLPRSPLPGTVTGEALSLLCPRGTSERDGYLYFYPSLFSESLSPAVEELTGCSPASRHLLLHSVAPTRRPPWTAPPWRTSGARWRASRRAAKMELKKQHSWSSNLLTVSTRTPLLPHALAFGMP